MQRAERLISEKEDKTKEVEHKRPSEQLTRIFKSYDIPVYHKPINTLRSLLVYPKDKTDKAAKCGVVYDNQCPDCNQHNIGETARPLGTRIKEHLLYQRSAKIS